MAGSEEQAAKHAGAAEKEPEEEEEDEEDDEGDEEEDDEEEEEGEDPDNDAASDVDKAQDGEADGEEIFEELQLGQARSSWYNGRQGPSLQHGLLHHECSCEEGRRGKLQLRFGQGHN